MIMFAIESQNILSTPELIIIYYLYQTVWCHVILVNHKNLKRLPTLSITRLNT